MLLVLISKLTRLVPLLSQTIQSGNEVMCETMEYNITRPMHSAGTSSILVRGRTNLTGSVPLRMARCRTWPTFQHKLFTTSRKLPSAIFSPSFHRFLSCGGGGGSDSCSVFPLVPVPPIGRAGVGPLTSTHGARERLRWEGARDGCL